MEKINIKLDPEKYPILTSRYSEEDLKETLTRMCNFHYKGKEVTEERMYSVASMLESDLGHDQG